MVRKPDNIIAGNFYSFPLLLSRDYSQWLSEHSAVSVRLKSLLLALEGHRSPVVQLNGQEVLWDGTGLPGERKGTGELSGVYM